MSARAYRLLLLAYPASFRDRFASDMTAAFVALARERRARSGLPGVVLLWLRTLGDAVSNGLAERAALRRALRTSSHKGPFMWVSFKHDVRYALRTMRRSPAVTALVVLTMALGMGATAAIFSVVRAVILRPLPYADAGGLYTVWVDVPAGSRVSSGWLGPALGERLVPVAPPYLADLRARTTSFARMAGVSPSWNMTLTGSGNATVVQALYVSDGLLDILGLSPIGGRDFLAEEHVRGGPRAVLVSQSIWRQVGGLGAPDGRSITLNGEGYTVVGLLPESAGLPGTPGDIWIPFVHNQFAQARQVTLMMVLARLREGVSEQAARGELQSVAQSLERDFPTSRGQGLALVPFADRVSRRARPMLLVLGMSVALLTLIAVANVANLLLARASARQREIAVRTALGAGRWRIVRQVLTESALLALGGAIAGVAIAYWSLDALVALLYSDLPPRADVRVDWQVLAFTALVALGAGVLFGLAPAFEASRGAASDALRHGARVGEGGRRIRQALVAAEIALAFVLLIGAGLLVRSFLNLSSVSPGFRTESILTASIGLPAARYPDGASCLQFFERLLASVRSLPGVQSAALVNRLPLGGATNNAVDIQIEGRQPETEPGAMSVDRRVGSTDYFELLAIPVIAGRVFDERDAPMSPMVAVINQSMARRYWGTNDPLGARVRIQLLSGPGPWLTSRRRRRRCPPSRSGRRVAARGLGALFTGAGEWGRARRAHLHRRGVDARYAAASDPESGSRASGDTGYPRDRRRVVHSGAALADEPADGVRRSRSLAVRHWRGWRRGVHRQPLAAGHRGADGAGCRTRRHPASGAAARAHACGDRRACRHCVRARRHARALGDAVRRGPCRSHHVCRRVRGPRGHRQPRVFAAGLARDARRSGHRAEGGLTPDKLPTSNSQLPSTQGRSTFRSLGETGVEHWELSRRTDGAKSSKTVTLSRIRGVHKEIGMKSIIFAAVVGGLVLSAVTPASVNRRHSPNLTRSSMPAA